VTTVTVPLAIDAVKGILLGLEVPVTTQFPVLMVPDKESHTHPEGFAVDVAVREFPMTARL